MLFALGSCYDLGHSWRDDPYNRAGWVAFLFWLSLVSIRLIKSTLHTNPSAYLLAIGVAITTSGNMASLNVLNHIGMALIGAAVFRHPIHLACAWLSALSWMPVLGWLSSSGLGININTFRPLIALAFLLPVLIPLLPTKKESVA